MINRVSIRSIIVLTSIALVSGLLLALCFDVLGVSDDEKAAYRLGKLYPHSELAMRWSDERLMLEDFSAPFGEIHAVYEMEDGTLIVLAQGYGGFRGGWIRCFIAFTPDGVLHGLAVDSNQNQSYANKFDKKWIDANFAGKDVTDVTQFVAFGSGVGVFSIVAHATMTSNAMGNCVNTALLYLRYVGFL